MLTPEVHDRSSGDFRNEELSHVKGKYQQNDETSSKEGEEVPFANLERAGSCDFQSKLLKSVR